MSRSAMCFLVVAVLGLPAWCVNFDAVPFHVQIIWLCVELAIAMLGAFFRVVDGR